MTKSQVILLLACVGASFALPQGGYSSSRPATSSSASGYGSSSSSSPSQDQYQGSAASFGSGSFASSGGGFSSGGGGAGGNLQVECRRQEVQPGRFKFVCEGVNPNAISLRSEHILWLAGPEGQKQVLDIEVPNYKIEELIKAGFRTQPGEGTLINILLKRPEQVYDAQVDQISSVNGSPSVNLQYEPVEKTLVHFPTDKAYSPLQGPLIPPGGGRPQRQIQKQFSKPYSQVQAAAAPPTHLSVPQPRGNIGN